VIDHPDFITYPDEFFLETPGLSERLTHLLRLKKTQPIKPPAGLIRPVGKLELRFDLPDVLGLADHACRSVEHRPATVHYHDKRLWINAEAGYTPREIQSMRGRHVDSRKIPPALDLVRDDGIYLMSNGIPVQREPCGRSSKVAYADGFDPLNDERWEEFARAYLGRKDFSLPVPLSWIRRAQSRSSKSLTLIIDGNGLHAK